ncbi:integrase core domain-containing protein [Methylocystis sp.]|uniref:integrase core domain-containing protein n=1 Tax=Methylocystis sp. TaxID=1911079 RepID=UPI003DA359D8
MNRLIRQLGSPKYLFADSGAEFFGHLIDLWSYHHGTRIDLSSPGKPTANAFVETFNGSLSDECVASSKLAGSNTTRAAPHKAPRNVPPSEAALRAISSTACESSVPSEGPSRLGPPKPDGVKKKHSHPTLFEVVPQTVL